MEGPRTLSLTRALPLRRLARVSLTLAGCRGQPNRDAIFTALDACDLAPSARLNPTKASFPKRRSGPNVALSTARVPLDS